MHVDALLPVDHNNPVARQEPNFRACRREQVRSGGTTNAAGWLAEAVPELRAAPGSMIWKRSLRSASGL